MNGFSKFRKQALGAGMKEQFAQIQAQLAKLEVLGTAGNGLVKITLSGEKELKKIEISPTCVTPDDVEGLQDLILAAHRDAAQKLLEAQAQFMPGL